MNRDDVLQMAIEVWGLSAVLRPDEHVDGVGGIYIHSDENCLRELERFAALVAAHEREECARVCESLGRDSVSWPLSYPAGCDSCADAIRARGES